MIKIISGIIISLCLISQGYAADQWAVTEPTGVRNASDIDSYIGTNNAALDRLLYTYREGCSLVAASDSTITINSGALALPNADGSVVRWRRNTSNITATWTDIDIGAEAVSTTYYIYGVADTDATTFTIKISTSSSAPSLTPAVTYYRRLGSFYNDASGNITTISNDNNYYGNNLGSWVAKSNATTYQASTDGFAIGEALSGASEVDGYTDAATPPTTRRASNWSTTGTRASITLPVKKGEYWKITGADQYVYWVPLE